MNFSGAFFFGVLVASIPGPTGILIATETLRHGARGGLLTMLAPLMLDIFVMLPLGLLLQASLMTGNGAIILGLAGAAFLAWLGVESIRAGIKHVQTIRTTGAPPIAKRDLPPFMKGFITHATSPYPYVFWATAGGALVLQGYARGGIAGAALFPAGFWSGTTSFTFLLIYLVAHGKRLLPPRWEPYLHHISGVLLIGSAIYLAVRVWHGLF
ncbi:MAG TPA: LysE family translocator [Candidatus Binatia bacterium]|nr:LysE family translocator [Candidatus Binatia bacterium]